MYWVYYISALKSRICGTCVELHADDAKIPKFPQFEHCSHTKALDAYPRSSLYKAGVVDSLVFIPPFLRLHD